MKLICKVQDHLVTAHRATDNGDFIFVLCRRGLESEIGKKLKTGKKFLIDIDATFKQYIEE